MEAVVNLFNSADACIQAKSLAVMKLTVNHVNIEDFVNNLMDKTLLKVRLNAQG